jgi:hypothetical protein
VLDQGWIEIPAQAVEITITLNYRFARPDAPPAAPRFTLKENTDV